MKPPSTSSAWARSVVAMLDSQGLDVDVLFAELGLPRAWLDDADRRWPSETISDLWRLASMRSGSATLGLAAQHLVGPGHYGIVGYAMLSSPDLRTGLGRLIRYTQIVSDGAVIEFRRGPSGHWVTLGYREGHRPVPRQRVEYGLLVMLMYCRWMLGRILRPIALSFSFDQPSDDRPYREAFCCSHVRFGGAFSGFLIGDRDIQSALPSAVPELADIHDRLAGLALRKLGRPETTSRAQEAIAKRLQDGCPTRAQTAADLGLSEHTFQRRLTQERTSFSDVVDQTRQELAQRYLSDRLISLSEVVYLLGYSDQSTFFRACLRWFGESPGAYRHRLTNQ